MTMLASQPKMPPTMIIRIQVSIAFLLFVAAPLDAGRLPASKTRDARILFRQRNAMSSVGSATNMKRAPHHTGGALPNRRGDGRSIALLALVLVAVMLDARDPEARHAGAVD